MRLILCLMMVQTLALAKQKAHLPENITIDHKSYALCKSHTIRKAFVIQIAHVGLYLRDCTANENIMQIKDKLIRFNYQIGIKSTFFKKAAYEFFVKNIDGDISQQQEQELTAFNQLYQDMKSDDCYDLYHKKGQNLSLYKNNELLGSSSDPVFSQKYFTIWFGQYPATKKLKKAFLSSTT